MFLEKCYSVHSVLLVAKEMLEMGFLTYDIFFWCRNQLFGGARPRELVSEFFFSMCVRESSLIFHSIHFHALILPTNSGRKIF